MFLKKLYYHNKVLFFVSISFIIVFVFLNIKWGAVATPIYQYGMFSGVVHKRDTLNVFRFFVNNSPINLSRYPFAQRDMLQVSLQRFEIEKQNNEEVFATMKRILSAAGLGNLMKEKVFTNQVTDSQFTSWYKYLLQRVLGYKVEKVEVYKQKISWKAGSLYSISSPEKLIFIVAD